MRILIFTGNGGGGCTLSAAATAATAARAGKRTVLASLGPSHSLSALLGTRVSGQPQPVSQNLSAWNIDISGEVARYWQMLRTSAMPNLSPDELPLLPGADLLAGFARIAQIKPNEYDLLVLDAGQHDTLLRSLGVPDGFRWVLRLIFGLDRGPGRSASVLGSGLIPASLIPFDWINQLQDSRVELEQTRDRLIDPRRTTVRYVLRPDAAALEEAKLALPALQLFGLAVDGVIVAPLLPADSGPGLAAIVAEQEGVAAEASKLWGPRPLLRLGSTATPASVAGLEGIGHALYASHSPIDLYTPATPVILSGQPDPNVSIALPGLPADALGLTLSGDEIIVRIGPYRRHILLPDGLRGTSNIRAARSGERLIVKAR